MKKLVLPFILLSTVLAIISCSSKPDFEYDVVDAVISKDLSEGLNPISKSSSGNLELNIRASSGKKTEYVILLDGKPIQSNIVQKSKTTAGKSETTCWDCGKDAGGNTHCWKIPCPVIVGPWKPEISKKINIIKPN